LFLPCVLGCWWCYLLQVASFMEPVSTLSVVEFLRHIHFCVLPYQSWGFIPFVGHLNLSWATLPLYDCCIFLFMDNSVLKWPVI
jgi:hypothetical protein